MNGKCIFCLQDKALTDEHIIPESIGGSLRISNVCKDCNSSIGTDIDGTFINSFPVSLSRFVYNVPGKSGSVPKPFGGVGISTDGLKVRVDDDFKPHILPLVEEEATPDGEVLVTMIFDKSDEPRVPEEVLKKARRMLKKKYPSMQDSEIEERAQAILADARKIISTDSTRLTLRYQFSVDLAAMRLEYIKIAYEMAFYVFGYDYVTQSTVAPSLRAAVVERQSKPMLHWQIPLAPDQLAQFFPECDRHIVMLLNGAAYIRLFGMSALVQFEASDARFMCPDDRARVFVFDFVSRSHTEERFVDRLVRMMPQPSADAFALPRAAQP